MNFWGIKKESLGIMPILYWGQEKDQWPPRLDMPDFSAHYGSKEGKMNAFSKFRGAVLGKREMIRIYIVWAQVCNKEIAS